VKSREFRPAKTFDIEVFVPDDLGLLLFQVSYKVEAMVKYLMAFGVIHLTLFFLGIWD